jgi:hypothetical protein
VTAKPASLTPRPARHWRTRLAFRPCASATPEIDAPWLIAGGQNLRLELCAVTAPRSRSGVHSCPYNRLMDAILTLPSTSSKVGGLDAHRVSRPRPSAATSPPQLTYRYSSYKSWRPRPPWLKRGGFIPSERSSSRRGPGGVSSFVGQVQLHRQAFV